MTEAECRAIVERYLGPASGAVGIAHWKIEVEYGPCSNPNWGAENAPTVDYQHVRITLDPSRHDGPAQLVDSLIHELLHVLLTPFYVYRDFAVAFIKKGSPGDTQEDRLWTHAVERTVGHLELMHSLLTFSNPYRADGGGEYAVPLKKGYSRKTVSKNVSEMRKAGYPAKQAVAASLSSARKSAKAAGKPSKGPAPPKRKRKKS